MDASLFPSVSPKSAKTIPIWGILCIFLFLCPLPSQSQTKTDLLGQAEVAMPMGQKPQNKRSQPGPGDWEVEQGEVDITIQYESWLLCIVSSAIEGPA